MTVEVATERIDPPARARAANTVRTITLRWVILVSLTVLAFWRTIRAVADEMMARTLISYVPVMILLAVIAAVGVSRRSHDEPPIHDRQTDVIVATMILVPALALQTMVNPRYGPVYLTTHVDLLAAWMFTLGGAVVLFGLRPVVRYRWAWLIYLAIFPVPVRVAILWLGGGPLVAGSVLVALASVATAIAAGRTRRRALIGAALAGAVGVAGLYALYFGWIQIGGSRPPLTAMVSIPPLGCAVVACTVVFLDRRRRSPGGVALLDRPIGPPALPRVGRPLLLPVTCAVLLTFIPVPPVGTWPNTRIEQLATDEPLPVPEGWTRESVERYDWVTRLYGRDSVLIRQVLVQNEGSPEFDALARPRRVVVDTVDTARPLALEVYPHIFRYNLVGYRFSPSVEVGMPHGVRAWIWNLVDDDRYLTYDVVSWWWNNGYRTQQVIVWAVDNHEPDAFFPEPRITIAQNLNSLLTVLFRGNAVIEDGDPQYKNRDLVVPLSRAIVDATVAGGAG